MIRIYGIVVTFFPKCDIIKNINSYLPYISKLMIIDNTPGKSDVIKELAEKYYFLTVFNDQNRGVAFALNQGAEAAVKKNYNWLLTMDQDSCFPKTIKKKKTYPVY